MPAPEAGNARQLLVLLNQSIGFARDFRGRHFHLNFTLGIAGSFRGAHNDECKDI
jgi:hypothetical protein